MADAHGLRNAAQRENLVGKSELVIELERAGVNRDRPGRFTRARSRADEVECNAPPRQLQGQHKTGRPGSCDQNAHDATPFFISTCKR
jgi:hypothetical protein